MGIRRHVIRGKRSGRLGRHHQKVERHWCGRVGSVDRGRRRRTASAGAEQTRGPRHYLHAWGSSAGSQRRRGHRLRQRAHRAGREAERRGRIGSGRCGRSLRFRNDGDELAAVVHARGRRHDVRDRTRRSAARRGHHAGGDGGPRSRRRVGGDDRRARGTGGPRRRHGRRRHDGCRGTLGRPPPARLGSQGADARSGRQRHKSCTHRRWN